MQFTVIICTYQREELLAGSLRTLTEPEPLPEGCTLTVVDNAGTPRAREVAEEYGATYVHEPTVGLSHARNRGAAEAKTNWLVYLDDDIQAPPGLLRLFGERLRTADCAAVGGQYTHWFATPPPPWLLRYYVGPQQPSPATTFGKLPPGHYLSGGIMAIRRDLLFAVGGYNPALGMQGTRIARGEEDWVQDRLRADGHRICYDPDLTFHHLVQPYKYKLQQQVALAHAQGRASALIDPLPADHRWRYLLREAARVTAIKLPLNLARILRKRDYYWQNAYLDTVRKYAFILGRFMASR